MGHSAAGKTAEGSWLRAIMGREDMDPEEDEERDRQKKREAGDGVEGVAMGLWLVHFKGDGVIVGRGKPVFLMDGRNGTPGAFRITIFF